MKTILFLTLTAASFLALAWEGYDYKRGTHVEIEKGNLVRPGKEIEIFDYQKGRCQNVEVEAVHRNGSTVEVEVRDYQSGETRTLEMNDR